MNFIVHFVRTSITGTVYAPNAETAMDRAVDKYTYNTVSHVEEK